jgi:DNA-binding transcriptional LysR family regulator
VTIAFAYLQIFFMLSSEELLLVHTIRLHQRLDLAARALGQNHSTLFRRLLLLESRLGGELFVKSKGEYRPTALAQICSQSAQAWLTQQQVLTNSLQAHLLGEQSRLRITTTEDVAMFWLPQCLARLRQKQAQLSADVWIDEREWDLAKADAEVAIRPTRRPPEGWVGMELGTLEMAVYGNAAIARKWESSSQHSVAWITRLPKSGPKADRDWIDAHVAASAQFIRLNRVSALVEAVRQGAGAALLPCFVGDAMRLARLQPVKLGATPAKLWLLTHPDLRRDARVRALFAAARAMGKLQNLAQD